MGKSENNGPPHFGLPAPVAQQGKNHSACRKRFKDSGYALGGKPELFEVVDVETNAQQNDAGQCRDEYLPERDHIVGMRDPMNPQDVDDHQGEENHRCDQGAPDRERTFFLVNRDQPWHLVAEVFEDRHRLN